MMLLCFMTVRIHLIPDLVCWSLEKCDMAMRLSSFTLCTHDAELTVLALPFHYTDNGHGPVLRADKGAIPDGLEPAGST